MKSTTSTYKQIIASGNTRDFYVTINMTLADETTLTLTEEDIMSFKMETASSGNSSFDLGSAIIGMCKFSLENFDERYTSCEFFNATATVWVKLKGDSEYHRMGFYTVDEPEFSGAIVSLEMLDNMWKFDVPFSEVNLTFPCSCVTAVNAICTYCGVSLATNQFHGYSFTLESAPDRDMNCREFLQYVAMIGCNFCIIDDTGALRLKWYDVGSRPSDSLDGGTFSTNTTPYSDGDVADGGNFTNYYSGDDYDGGTFIDNDDVAWFTRNFNTSVGTDEIAITGVKFTLNNVDYKIGVDGYVLSLDNPLVNTGNVSAVLNLIWDVLEDFKLRTFNVKTLPDIAPEVGDCCVVKDLKGNFVYSWITNISFEIYSQTVRCDAITPSKKLTERYSKSVQTAVDEAREKTEQAISRYDVAVQLMNNIAVNAMGGYEDYEDLPTGGRIYYLSNEPITKVNNVCTFETGSTVFKATGSGFFVSTDGGQTYVNGYDPNTGALVVNVLNAIGVNAEWIHAGELEIGGNGINNPTILVKDSSNNPICWINNSGITMYQGEIRSQSGNWFLNATTGNVQLAATATVGGKTVQQIADEAQAAAEATSASALASAVLSIDSDIADLQNQIDGNITTWFYAYAPTTSNAPASTWVDSQHPTDPTIMINHIGDLFYDSTTGYCYRWQVKSTAADPTHPTVNDFEWVQISDEDIAAALEVARTAQDTADHKRRVFVDTPTTPYDVGDLWVQGSNGDIKRCATAKTSTQTYSESDWVLASKYTDDTLAKAQYGTCSTGASTTAKVVTLSNFVLYTGARISVQFTNANTASSPTLNVNSTGAKPIYAKGAVIASTYYWNANALVDFVYDGTNWVMQVKDYIEVFNELTNGGTIQGIFLNNGQLYVNGTYIQSKTVSADAIYGGTLELGGSNNVNGIFVLKDANGNAIVTANKDGLSTTELVATGNCKFGNLQIGSRTVSAHTESYVYAWGNRILFEKAWESLTSNFRQYVYFSPYYDGWTENADVNIDFSANAGASHDTDMLCRVTLYRWTGSSWSSQGYRRFNADGDELDNKNPYFDGFTATDDNYYRLKIRVIKETWASDYELYIDTTTQHSVELNPNEVIGSFRGNFSGSATLNALAVGDTEFNFDGSITNEDEDSSTSYSVAYGGFNSKKATNNYTKLSCNNEAKIAAYKSSTEYIDLETSNPSLRIQDSSSEYVEATTSGIACYTDFSKYVDISVYPQIKVYNSSSNYIDISADNKEIRLESTSNKYVQFRGGNDLYDKRSSSSTWSIAWTSSDRRNKEEIEDLDIELSKNFIDATETKKFKYKDQDGKHYGMIAQDVRELLDNLGETDSKLEYRVNEEDEYNPRNINYSEYVPHLINYVKDLRAELNAVKEELRQLKEGK